MKKGIHAYRAHLLGSSPISHFCSPLVPPYPSAVPQVTFRNEETGEYLLYLLNFRTTAPGVIRTIEMSTLVRQCTSASVRVENPLPAVLVFTVECRSPDVSLPSQISVPAATWVQFHPLCHLS